MTIDPRPGPDPALARLVPDLQGRGLDSLAAIARYVDVPPGAYLLREAEPARNLGTVISGRLAVRAWVPGQAEATLMTLDAGDVFGWSAVLDRNATATIVAVDDARVLLLPSDALRQAMAADVELAARLYRRLLEVVEERLAATRLQMLDLYRAGGSSR
jgi:CRP/FNR family transcriptional regulator, cyclic AMP receptor protein